MTVDLLNALPDDWAAALEPVLQQPKSKDLQAFLQQELAAGKAVFPPQSQWFRGLECSPLEKTRVVILGQDPYPTAGHAHGLSFSVDASLTKLPRSLINIYKELVEDLKVTNTSGDLSAWAEQGVLLLNSVLTVKEGKAGSHQKKGWEEITDAAIAALNEQNRPIVFLLWGAYAQKKGKIIDRSRHKVLESVHPSPLSAYRGFFGSKPFSAINEFLLSQGQTAINWQIEG